jgi:hypothetical protein
LLEATSSTAEGEHKQASSKEDTSIPHPPQAVDAGSLLYTIHRDHNGNVLGTGVHLMAVTGGGNGSVVVLEDRRFDHCTFDPWELHYSGDLEQELVQGDEFPHGL